MVSLATLVRGGAPPAKRATKEKRATAIYVAPSGSDSNAGTLSAPLLTIQAAVDKAVAGDTIYLRAGTYKPTVSIKFNKSGTSSARYTIQSYNNEQVIVDGENMPYTPADLGGSIPNADRGIFHIEGSYWSFIDIELINGPYGIFARDASNNRYERLRAHDNYESGIQIQGTASNNLVLNCDTYANRDPRKNGESADGLAIKEGSGTGNVVRGLRTWNNVDDGVDFWLFESAITIENSYSWGNGYNRWNFTPFEGDDNDFKLGGGGGAAVNHIIRNNIAFQNAHNGITDNSQTGVFQVTSNTAWKNEGGVGFFFKTAAGSTLTKCISVNNGAGQTDLAGVTNTNNSWNSGTWRDASFVSTDSSILKGPRLANGSVVANSFLLPASTAPTPTIGTRIWGV